MFLQPPDKEACSGAPVDAVIHLDAFVDLAEELVDPADDGGEGGAQCLLRPVRLRENLVHVLLKSGTLDAALKKEGCFVALLRVSLIIN